MDKLCSGQVLNVEELVDVLTLKENRGEAVGDAVKAMDRLARAGVSVIQCMVHEIAGGLKVEKRMRRADK